MSDFLNSPLLVTLAAFFITAIICVAARKERIPGFLFLLFASLGAFFAVANIQKIAFLKAFVLIFFFIVLVFSGFLRGVKKPLLNIALLLVFIGAVLISGFVNSTPFATTRSYIGTMVIAIVIAFCPTNEKTLKLLMVAIAIWGIVNLVAALFQLSGHGWMYKGDPFHTGFRMEGLMGTSTMMGIYFALALNAMHVLYLSAKKRFWRIVTFALGAGLFLGLMGTLSRAAVLGWAVSFLFIQYRLYGMKLSSIVGIAVFVLVAVALSSLLNLDDIMLARFVAMKKDPSAQNRIPLIMKALEYLSEKPLFGVGLSQGGLYAKNVVVNTHNTIVQRLMENGIAGFAVFAGIVFRSIEGFLRRTGPESGEIVDEYRIGFLAMLISIFIMGQFHDFSYLMPLWVVLGVGLMPWKKLEYA